MKKIILSLILSFGLLLAEHGVSVSEDIDTVDIFLILKSINDINKQFQQAKADSNNTEIAKNFAGIEEKKDNFLKEIPVMLINGEVKTRKTQKEYQKEQEKIIKNIKKYSTPRQKVNNIKEKIALDNSRMNQYFDNALISLNNAVKELKSQNKIEQILEESMLSFQSINLNEYREFVKAHPDNDEIKFKAQSLEVAKTTYVDILDYLHKNSIILHPNYFFSSLNIKSLIDYLNKKIPSFFGLDIGKIIISAFVLVFFWSLRRITAKLIFFLFLAVTSKQKHDNEIKSAIIKTITRPITWFLFINGLDICVRIFYYPSPTPIGASNIFLTLYIVLIAWFFITLLESYGTILISTITKNSGEIFRKEVINLILKILYFIIIVIAFITILSKLGFDISALIASLGIGGLAVALAAKDILANFFASIMLLFDNSFSQGDWIVCGDVEGTVVEIGLRKTTIRTFDNALLFVPNAKLANESIKNWNRRKVGRRIRMHIGLTYDSPKDKIEQCVQDIREMLLAHPDIAQPTDTSLNSKDYKMAYKKDIISIEDFSGYKRTLMVYLDVFNASSIDILIYCFSKTTVWAKWLETKEDVMFKIMDIVQKHNLSFAFPSQSLYIESTPNNNTQEKAHI